MSRSNNNNNNSNSFKKRKFFVPTLIIFTFFLFAIIPDQLHLFLFYIYDIGSVTFLNAILLLYVVGFICDAAIYIFFQKTTYAILCKKLRRLLSDNIVNPDVNFAEKPCRGGNHGVSEVNKQVEDSNKLSEQSNNASSSNIE